MATTNIVPVPNALLETGDSFSCVVTASGASEITIEASDGLITSEVWTLTGGFGVGYTGSVSTVSGVSTLTDVARTAGWWNSPLVFTVTVTVGGIPTEQSWTYYLKSMATYPPGTKPYNEAFESGISVTEDSVLVADNVNQFDFDDATFDVTETAQGTARIVGLGGGGGSAVEVEDNTNGVLTTDVSKLTFGTGITASEPDPGSDEVLITVPSGVSGDGIPSYGSWTYDISTVHSDPGPGVFRLNSTNPSAASQLLISKTNLQGQTRTDDLEQLEGWRIIFQNEFGTEYLSWNCQEPSDSGNYYVISGWSEGVASFTNATDFTVNLIATYNFPMLNDRTLTNNAIVRGHVGGRDVQDSGVLIDDSNVVTGATSVQIAGSPTSPPLFYGTGYYYTSRVFRAEAADDGSTLDMNARGIDFINGAASTYLHSSKALDVTGDSLSLNVYDGKLEVGTDVMGNLVEIEFGKGFTVGETATRPVTPVPGKGQFWVRASDGKPMFTTESDTDYDLSMGAGGTGDVTGPGPTVADNAVARFDGTGGLTIQDSPVVVGDTGNVTGVLDLSAETFTLDSGGETTEYAAYGIAPYASRVTGFSVGGVPQTGTVVDISVLGMASNETGLKGGTVNVFGGNAQTGNADGGDLNLSGGAGVGTGALGKVFIEGSELQLSGIPLTTDSTIDGIDVFVDVTANTNHAADTTTNPHAVNLGVLGAGTLAQLTGGAGGVVADVNQFFTDNASEIDSMPVKATPVVGDMVLIEDSADSFNKKKAAWPTAGGGDVSAVGSPNNTEYARWTSGSTIEGRTLAETQADLGITNVTIAGATMADNTLVRGDGGSRGVQDSGISIDDADNVSGVTTLEVGGVTLSATALEETTAGYFFGGADGGATPADNVFTAGTSNSASVKAGSNYTRGGLALGTTSEGGDLNLYGGPGSSGPGAVRIGGYDTTVLTKEIEMMKGFSIRESADHPNVTVAGRGQLWPRTSDGALMWTDSSDVDHDLTATGGGGGALNDLSDVTLTTPSTDAVLIKTAGDWVDGTINTNSVTNGAITYAKMQQIATDNKILGFIGTGPGEITELTGGNVVSILPEFSKTAIDKGVVVGSNNLDATHYLDASGAWSVPAGGGGEVNDLTAAVTWANVPDANVTQSSVTQHVGAIDHNSTLNYAATEHVDWAAASAGTIHTDNLPNIPEDNIWVGSASSVATATTPANARTALDVDQAGTDNSTDVTLAGTPDYITIDVGTQVITRNPIVATTDLSATGTKNSTTFLRGDDTWDTPAGGGDVTAAATLTEDYLVIGDTASKAVKTTTLTAQNVTDNNAKVSNIDHTGDVVTVGATATIQNNVIDFDKMAHSTAASVFIFNGAGVPTNTGAGISGQVLTSNGASSPTWEDATGGGTVTSVAISATDGLEVDSGSPITTSGTITLGSNKLAGIEALADVTDTANVTAAGALMESEVTSLSGIKSLVVDDSTTISTFASTLLDDTTQGAMQTTLNVDPAGTDNSTNVTLAGENYLSLSTQQITANAVNLSGTNVTGDLPIASIAGTPTGTGNLVLETSPTIVTPTIASFTNAQHDHVDAAGGGQLGTTALVDDAVTLAKIDAHTGLVAGVLGYGASGTPTEISSSATTGHVLKSAGTGATPVFGQLVADSYGTGTIAVTRLADGTDGELITWSTAGVATTVAAGADGHVLTSKGAGAVPVFEAAPTAPTLRHFPTQYIEDPTAADDVRWFKTPVAITVQGIDASVTGTSPDVDFTIYHASTRNAAGTVVHTADTITSVTGTGFTAPSGDATIPAGNYVWTEIDVIAGTVDSLELCMHYTED